MKSRLMKMTIYNIKKQTNMGVYDADGFPEDPIIVNDTITANIQPITGKELLQVPEGDRLRSWFKVFTKTKLTESDTIEISGEDYEVRTVEDWTMYSCLKSIHYNVKVVRVDVAR